MTFRRHAARIPAPVLLPWCLRAADIRVAREAPNASDEDPGTPAANRAAQRIGILRPDTQTVLLCRMRAKAAEEGFRAEAFVAFAVGEDPRVIESRTVTGVAGKAYVLPVKRHIDAPNHPQAQGKPLDGLLGGGVTGPQKPREVPVAQLRRHSLRLHIGGTEP